MEVKVLVFDFDGTIADSLETTAKIFKGLAEEFDFDKPGVDGFKIYREIGAKEAVKVLEIPIRKLPAIMNKYREEVSKIVATLKPFDGLREILLELKKQGFTLGVLTSNSEANINKFLENNDLTFFDFVYSKGSLFGKDKVMKRMLNDLKLKPAEVVYVCDETRDVVAAKKVGIKSAAVTWGYNPADALKKESPDYIIHKPEELIKLSSRLTPRT